MATLRHIKQDEELLVEYGPDYWRVHDILKTHVWKPLDKLQEQRQREGQMLLASIEQTNKRCSELSAENLQLQCEVAELRRQLKEAQGQQSKRQRKQPMPVPR